jgi:hypothetical protein
MVGIAFEGVRSFAASQAGGANFSGVEFTTAALEELVLYESGESGPKIIQK